MSYSDLPLLNELLKPHACNPQKTDVVCGCKSTEEHKQIPSRSLQNWKKWMNRRKKIHLKLAAMVQREPGTLLMNHSEELRTVLERKTIVEHALLAEYKDAKIPQLEYVAVPNKIMIEKDVNTKQRTITTWTEYAYFKSRCEELKLEMNVVEPHKPELSNLCIEGFSSSDKLTTNQESGPNFNTREQENLTNLKVSLLVNGVLFTPTEKQAHTRKVYIMFDYDVTTNKVATQFLSLKNIGNTTVHYSWEPVKNIPLFRDILPVKEHNTYFFFNKNNGVVVPDETLNLPIWFDIRQPGVYCENWEFRTRPKIVPANSRLIVVFHASAVTGDLDEKIELTRDRLNANIRDRLIRETLSSVLSKVQYDKFKPTIYCYNKKEVFEAMSATYDPTNLFPKYEYNKDIVRELQKFYKNVRRTVDPKNWNYNIYELKVLTNAKQRSNENAKNVSDQQITKKLEAACPVLPLLESPRTIFPQTNRDSRLQVKSTVLLPDQLNELKKQLGAEAFSLNDELEKLLSKLERPNTEKNFEKDKYKKIYLLLCTCFNKIENEIENLKSKLSIDVEATYPQVCFVEDSYKYERLLDAFVKPTLKDNTFDCRYKPANDVIRNLPVNECTLRYKSYFNLPDSPSDALRRKELSKLLFKKPDDLKKTKTLDNDEDDGYPINEAFDPYAKLELIPFKKVVKTPEIVENVPIEKPENIQVIKQHYKYYIYVIVYNYLQDAIDDIIDMLEMYSLQRTPYPVIKEIEGPNYNRRLVDLKSLITLENLDNLKAKMVLNNYRKQSQLDWKTIQTQRELKRVQSCSSLWSILRPYEKPELYEEKPISYPSEIYENEMFVEIDKTEKVVIDKTTSTTDAQLDVTWKDIKESSIQKEYEPGEKIDDLEAYIEKVKSETSAHSLIDFTFDKEAQKNLDSHVSDQEHFYYSVTDSELSDASIESLQSDPCSDDEVIVKKITCDCPK